MSGEEHAEVYYSNGAFLLFSTNHALQLRRRRILSQPVSNNSSTGPYCLSPYAARMVAQKGLATFKQLAMKKIVSIEENQANYDIKLRDYTNEQRELYKVQRLAELKRHNVAPTPRTIGNFDETKLKLPIQDSPDPKLSSFDEISMQTDDVIMLIDNACNEGLRHVYYDLYKRGFYVSSGMKFGSDFLAYLNDPVRYHAQYAIRLVCSDELGLVDLDEINFCEINSLQRLTHTANKVPLLATVILNDQPGSSSRVSYWTLGERVYLTPDSKKTDFEPIEPELHCSTRSAAIGNKVIRIS